MDNAFNKKRIWESINIYLPTNAYGDPMLNLTEFGRRLNAEVETLIEAHPEINVDDIVVTCETDNFSANGIDYRNQRVVLKYKRLETEEEYNERMKTTKCEDVTEETFHRYYDAQMSGEYNMIMDASKVMEKYHISQDDYLKIIANYKVYLAKYNK